MYHMCIYGVYENTGIIIAVHIFIFIVSTLYTGTYNNKCFIPVYMPLNSHIHVCAGQKQCKAGLIDEKGETCCFIAVDTS